MSDENENEDVGEDWADALDEQSTSEATTVSTESLVEDAPKE